MLNTDTGPVNLRAEFEPETINLKWYNGNNQITVPNASNSCTYDTAISLPTDPVKPGYKFKGWNVIPGTPVEYIQSTGTEMIDTGILFNTGNIKILANFYSEYVTNELDFMGNIEGSYPIQFPKGFCIGNWQGNGIFLYARPSSEGWRQTISAGWHDIKAEYTNGIGTFWIDSAKIATLSDKNFYSDASNIYLFKGGQNYLSSGPQQKINTVSIYINGVLTRDYIPIKDYNNVPCMYDKVSKQCFYNSGTGNFTAGPEI